MLVAGGEFQAPVVRDLYDPETGTWAATGGLANPRTGHTATMLSNGKVLVADGEGLARAELYHKENGSWAAIGSLANTRSEHTATLLVLVAGCAGTSVELYNSRVEPGPQPGAEETNINDAVLLFQACLCRLLAFLAFLSFGTAGGAI